MLVIIGGNPAYNTPADLRLDINRFRVDAEDREGRKVPLRIHLGLYQNETAEVCHWHIPEKHYLESWGDARAYDGTATIIQPLIQPLYDGKSANELAQLFFRENYDKRDYDIIKENWQRQGFANAAPRAMATTATAGNQTQTNNQAQTNNQSQQTTNRVLMSNEQPRTPSATQNQSAATSAAPPTMPNSPQSRNANPAGGDTNPVSGAFEDNWRRFVHNGFVPNSAATAKTVAASGAFMNQPTAPASGDLEISIRPDPSVYDGRFANNGWLQELPNPLTKITWDNVALVSPNTAKRLV